MENLNIKNTRAQESRAAISRLYIAMRHLFIRGNYKPLGASGEAMINALLTLKPEIYGSIADEEKVELKGLLYVFHRLPEGIEQCRYIKLIAREGFEDGEFQPLIPSKRRRNCYRIDEEQMFIEMTRGRSDIYDVLTHLTFLFIESEKIRKNSFDIKNRPKREWAMLEQIVQKIKKGKKYKKEIAYTYLSAILGRTYHETASSCEKFESAKKVNSLFEIVYWLGKRSQEEAFKNFDREITFSSALREKLGKHIHGELWADKIKSVLIEKKLTDRSIHVISSNMHSVMNCLYGQIVNKGKRESLEKLAQKLSKSENKHYNTKIKTYAAQNGLTYIPDESGTNLNVQIIEMDKVSSKFMAKELGKVKDNKKDKPPILLVIDYPFGEQAYEIMDELLKPYSDGIQSANLNIASINVMGKAGILQGGKGDIMIPTAHIFEGTADNYPFENELNKSQFKGHGVKVFEGAMVTVLGTSLQNKDILKYFHHSSWKVIGLEMEGAHYQKAIQAASKIRKSINPKVKLRYAYYASDNPLETGSTLASGSLGMDGVGPTYLITSEILCDILN